MQSVKEIVKRVFRTFGLTVAKRDPLAELIPDIYFHSRFLPPVSRYFAFRLLYMRDMLERIRGVEGEIVECGVSVGHGILYFMLLNDLIGKERPIHGFDSFEGFPAPNGEDLKADNSFHREQGNLASPLHLVRKVLTEGGVSQRSIDSNLTLTKGFFEETLHKYQGEIALLHLDCDLYQSYKVCLEALYDKVVPGGLILFDEYGDPNWPGAKKAADEFFADKAEQVEEYNRYGYKKGYVLKVQSGCRPRHGRLPSMTVA